MKWLLKRNCINAPDFASIVHSCQIKAHDMYVRYIFTTCMCANVSVVELDYTIWLRTISRLSGFLWHSFKLAADSVVSFNIRQGLKWTPTLPIGLLCSNYTLP